MKAISTHPLTFVVTAALFIWLAIYSQTPRHDGYTHAQVRAMRSFVAAHVRPPVYHPKTARESAQIAAEIWGIE